jgi:hypothetical protein
MSQTESRTSLILGRLLRSARIFLDLGSPPDKPVDKYSIPEDAKLPEFRHPTPDESDQAIANTEYNRQMDSKPTSVMRETQVFVQRLHNGGVELHQRTTRVDLGYKIPTISVNTGDLDQDRQSIVEEIAGFVNRRRSRTPEEKNRDRWNASLRQSLLSDESLVIRFPEDGVPASLTQRDNIIGLSLQTSLSDDQKLPSDVEKVLFNMGFNLVSSLRGKQEVNPEISDRIQSLVDTFKSKTEIRVGDQ